MSIISYFGSKSSNVFMDFINSKIPSEGIDVYVEPFSGSFATYLDDDNLNFDTVIYNDRNRHQTNLLKCCSNPEKFVPYLDKLKQTLLYTTLTNPIDKWEFYKKIYKDYQRNDFLDDYSFEIGDYTIAAIYSFLITSSHNSTFPRGAGFNGYNKQRDRLKLEILIDKLRKNKYTNKLQTITEFRNEDFEPLIKNYDSPQTFFYLDPPYARFIEGKSIDDARRLFWYGSDSSVVFGPESHRRLLELLLNTQARWALSYYYFPLLDELLPRDKYHWFSKEVDRSSARGGNNALVKKKEQKGVELLITNYPV